MKITGHHSVPFPVETVWNALLDPAVLVSTLPGCERLVATGDNSYAMTVSAGVAAIRGTYDGTCTLSDLQPHESLLMSLQGAGAPGTVDATVHVAFAPVEEGTRISYAADASVGGMVGGVGQRMLGSVSKRMADEFFGNVTDALSGGQPGAVPGAVSAAGAPAGVSAGAPTGGPGTVYTPPARPPSSSPEFLRGIAVGAGLVLLGVLAGRLLGRRG
jgi:carbon monoxide dehydrogenase subunit G